MLIQNGSNVFSEINGRYPLHLIFRSVDDGNFERVQSKDPVHILILQSLIAAHCALIVFGKQYLSF